MDQVAPFGLAGQDSRGTAQDVKYLPENGKVVVNGNSSVVFAFAIPECIFSRIFRE
jgi:hypothetical protein